MTWALIVSSEAEQDLAEAKSWYNSQRAGLGDALLENVEVVFRALQTTPQMHAIKYQDIRRALVRRFPYQILYRIEGDSVVVIAVFHNRRDPRQWQVRV